MPRKLHPNLHMRGRRYYCFRNDENGKRHEVSLRTDDLEIALQRYNTRSEEVKLRLAPEEMCKARLDDAAKRWLERRSLRFTKGTVRAERSIVRTLVRELKGDTKLEALAKIDKIYEFQDARLRSGISPKTVNNEVQVLALILRDAKLWHRVQTSYKPMKCRPVDIADALTVEQQLKLIAVATHAEPLAVAPYVAVLALDTGMRSGEIKQLELGDLHHEVAAPYLIVRRATTKTDAGARRVSLGQLAVWAISKLLFRARELGAQRLTDCLLPTDRTRHTRSTDPLRGSGYDPNHPQTSWDAEWARLRQQVGIENRRFHDLRHTYITRSAEAGVPIPTTRTQVGHLSEAMTRYYTHIGQQAQYEATRQIERHRPELLKLIGLPKPDAIGKDRLEFERVVEGTASRRKKLTIN